MHLGVNMFYYTDLLVTKGGSDLFFRNMCIYKMLRSYILYGLDYLRFRHDLKFFYFISSVEFKYYKLLYKKSFCYFFTHEELF